MDDRRLFPLQSFPTTMLLMATPQTITEAKIDLRRTALFLQNALVTEDANLCSFSNASLLAVAISGGGREG